METVPIIQIDTRSLAAVVIIAAIETVGIVQLLKGFFNGSHPKWGVVTIFVAVCCAVMHTHLIPKAATVVFDIVSLVIAVSTLAYQTVADGFTGLVARAMRTEVKNHDAKK